MFYTQKVISFVSSATICFLIVLFGCQPKPNEEFYKIINDNFLNFVDTVTYKTGKLILIPKDTSVIQSYTKKGVSIVVDTVFVDSGILDKSLATEIKDQNIEEFDDLLIDGETKPCGVLDLSLITKTGRYILVPSSGQKNIDTSYAGRISFGKPFIKKDKAIIIFSVSDSQKAGRSVAFFLKKEDSKWGIFKKIELERW